MSLINYFLSNRFVTFSTAHCVPFIFAFLLLFLMVGYAYDKSLKVKRNVGLIVSVISFITNLIFNFLFHCDGEIENIVPNIFPIWFCGLIAPVAIYGFLKQSSMAFTFVYLAGMSANLVACITPEVYYTYPSLEYFAFFTCHPINLILPLYIILVMPFRVSWLDYVTIVVVAHLIVIMSHAINLLFDTNINFTVSKPTTITIFDALGEWPYYLFSLQGISLVITFVFYLLLREKPQKELAK